MLACFRYARRMKLHRATFTMLVTVLLALAGCARDTTIILVRHAEKGAGQDPPLTPAGQQRAEALREALSNSGVSTIYVSNFQRTQQTAAPTATAHGLTPIVVAISGTAESHAAEVASRIRALTPGTRILVVGHSNTVPLIMQELGVTNPPSIAETEFDRFFVVLRRKDATTRLIESRYGN